MPEALTLMVPVAPPPTAEEKARAIRTAKANRANHLDWLLWAELHPDDPRLDAAGDAKHHREAAEEYDLIIRVLEAAAVSPP